MTQRSSQDLFNSLHITQQKILWLLVNNNSEDWKITNQMLFTSESDSKISGHYRSLKEKGIIRWKDSHPFNTNECIDDIQLEEFVMNIAVEQLYDRAEVLQIVKNRLKDNIHNQLAALNHIGIMQLDVGYLDSVYCDAIDETLENLEN